MSSTTMNKYKKGTHILGEILSADSNALTDIDSFKKFIESVIIEHELEQLGFVHYKFDIGGFTSVICLSESHIALHTWPEFNMATLDVFLCNYSRNNDERTKIIFNQICEYFYSNKVTFKILKR